jgi:hypothetical protein
VADTLGEARIRDWDLRIGGADLFQSQRGILAAHRAAHQKEVAMTHGALQVSAIALGAAAFVSLSLPSAASAATTIPQTVHHTYSHHYTPHAHTIWRNGRRYVWNGHSYVYSHGYNPGAAVAAGVIGSVAGAVAGYPYSCDNWPYNDYCPGYAWGSDYGPYGGGYWPGSYGWGYGYSPGWYGHRW